MENKQAFKLNFIKKQLENDFKSYKKRQKKKLSKQKLLNDTKKSEKQIISYNPTINLKFLDPISIHKIVGDMMFLDKIDDSYPFIGFSTIRNYFKKIKSININKNYLMATYEDYNMNQTNSKLLVERLKSLGDSVKNDLANQIESLENRFSTMSLSIKENKTKTVEPDYIKNLDNYNKILNEDNHPILFFHFAKTNSGMSLKKYGLNNMVKQMTVRDDIGVFEEGIVLIPTIDYYQHNKELLENLFVKKDEPIKMFISTIDGVKEFYGKDQTFWIKCDGVEEKVVLICFPKELQNQELQQFYDVITEETYQINKVNEPKIMEKEKKIKSYEEWEKILKLYFKSWGHNDFNNNEHRRCKYKLIKTNE